MTQALEECEKRFASPLVEVRNESLRTVLLASDALKTEVFSRPDSVLSVLTGATRNLTHVTGLNKEMGRCLAAISANICCEKTGTLSEEQKKVMSYARNGVSELLVPTLLSFWSRSNDRSAKCVPRDRETDKQIIRLLGVLYGGDLTQYANLPQNTLKEIVSHIEKRLATMDKTSPKYVRMYASLFSTQAVLSAAVSV